MKCRRKKNFLFFCGIIIFLLTPLVSYAYGLETGFGKIILENVPIGINYSMRDNAKFPLTIKNTGDKKVTLKIEVLIPQKDEIQKGYEAIPETNWIKLEKEEFVIPAKGEAETDVVISIPDEKKYLGKKFHAFIWSRTVEDNLGVGIKSKLLINTKETKKEL